MLLENLRYRCVSDFGVLKCAEEF